MWSSVVVISWNPCSIKKLLKLFHVVISNSYFLEPVLNQQISQKSVAASFSLELQAFLALALIWSMVSVLIHVYLFCYLYPHNKYKDAFQNGFCKVRRMILSLLKFEARVVRGLVNYPDPYTEIFGSRKIQIPRFWIALVMLQISQKIKLWLYKG